MQKPDLGYRLGSMVLDHFAMSFVALLFLIPMYSSFIFYAFAQQEPSMSNPAFFIAFLGFSAYINKDAIQGRSLAKRGLNLQVVNVNTGLAASPLRCFVRNLFLLIWPIEFIVALINPSQRIGDLVAGTKVIQFDKSIEQPKVNYTKVFIAFLIGYMMVLPIPILAYQLQEEFKADSDYYYDERYSDYQFNRDRVLSDQITTTLRDSLDEYIIPKVDIEIVDAYEREVKGDIWIKSNVITEEDDVYEIHVRVINTLETVYPHLIFYGEIEYSYILNGKDSQLIVNFDTDEEVEEPEE